MEQTANKPIASKEELHGIVRSSLLESGVYDGMSFMFLCVVEDGKTYIDSIKACDWKHDATVDMDEALENGWKFFKKHRQAYAYAESVIFPETATDTKVA